MKVFLFMVFATSPGEPQTREWMSVSACVQDGLQAFAFAADK
jgi:hypothetical protein